MKDTFTRQEVFELLLAIVMFSHANDNQGLKAMSEKQVTFGDKALHLLNVADNIDLNNGKSMLTVISKIRMD